ncbi:MAG: alcohol dehydrogenase catalytic domain-containing protein [Streptosporangiaceae bacterium]
MRFVEVSPGYATLREGPSPELPPGSARLRVTACGVCGTDVHALHGMVLPRGATYPVHPGHEVAGIVTELHDDARGQGDVQEGDAVVLHPLDSCGACEACRSGEEQRCGDVVTLGLHVPGGMADEIVWPVRRMVPVGDLPPTETALLADAAATAYHALRRAELPTGGTLCVLGAGGIGTQVLKLARALDPSVQLAAVVRSAASAERVAGLDVHVVRELEGAHREVRKAVGPVDAVVDFTGARGAAAGGIRMLKRGGKLVIGSVVDEPITLGTSVTGITSREISVVGAYVSSMDELRAVAKLARGGAFDLSDSVSHRYPLERAVEAIRMVEERPAGLVRLVLEP